MPEYQLQIKQVVDYPRCRIYREFIHKLINDRSIRINGGSGLFHFTVLCSYANFRTSYRRIDGISYTVSPGEWVCTVKELSCWFRTRFHRQALSMLDTLQKQHLISYTLLGRGNVGMFVALDFVWDRAKADRTEEKAIFIDECWQLLSGAGAAGVRLAGDFLLEIAKTIRGYGGASIFASQDLADFFDLDGGRFGKGIINNSKTKIILNLEDDEAQRVQEALHLSDAETMEITHFERGHGLISTNNNNIMVEFKASPLEKDLITTDRRELREIVERKRREQSTSAEQQI